MDLTDRIMELYQNGYQCSQILAILILETIGEDNPEVVRALGGLSVGVGFSGGTCGCMTGGCCMLSYFTAKADDLSYDSPYHRSTQVAFTKWFTEMIEENYDTEHFYSINCDDIVHGSAARKIQYCPQLIAQSYEKCIELLEEKGLLTC